MAKDYEPQTKTVEADIPDAELKKPEPIKLSSIVQNERDMRRYIRKDGVFRKNFEVQFKDKTKTKTKAQAEEVIRDQCKLTGRKVETESLTGRLKAVPGWDLTIRVPGMAREEQQAPKPPDGETRQKINESLLLSVQEENKVLKEQLAEINARLDGKTPDEGSKSLKDMSNKELDEYAERNNISLKDCTNKADKVTAIIDAEKEEV